MTSGRRDPIDEGWIARGAPMDLVSSELRACVRCGNITAHDRYRVILGRWVGVGAPVFLKPFLRRSSTAGKIGLRSVWDFCQGCGGFTPVDNAARGQAAELGMP
jgi:hypothetical protein